MKSFLLLAMLLNVAVATAQEADTLKTGPKGGATRT